MFDLSCYWPFQNRTMFRALYVRFVLLLTASKWYNFCEFFMSCYWPFQNGTLVPGSFMFVLSCYWQFKLRTIVPGSLCSFCLAADCSKEGQLFQALYVRFVLLLTAPKLDKFFGLFRFNLLLTALKWDKCSGLFMFVSSCSWLFQRGIFQGS